MERRRQPVLDGGQRAAGLEDLGGEQGRSLDEIARHVAIEHLAQQPFAAPATHLEASRQPRDLHHRRT